jgi:hypothetical protein
MGQPTDYEYKPGFGLEDLARAAYEPLADVTPGVGDVRAAERGGEWATQAASQARRGEIGGAALSGLASLGEYATTVPGIGEAVGLGKMAMGGIGLGLRNLSREFRSGGIGHIGGPVPEGSHRAYTWKEDLLEADQDADWRKMWGNDAIQRAETGVNSSKVIVMMSPQEFLLMAKDMKADEVASSAEKFANVGKAIAQGKRMETLPELQVNPGPNKIGDVVGHDGRHRAMQAARLGIKEMPVVVDTRAQDAAGTTIRWNSLEGKKLGQGWPAPDERDIPGFLRGENGQYVKFPTVLPQAPSPAQLYRAIEAGTSDLAAVMPREMGRHAAYDRKISETFKNTSKAMGDNYIIEEIPQEIMPKNPIDAWDPITNWSPTHTINSIFGTRQAYGQPGELGYKAAIKDQQLSPLTVSTRQKLSRIQRNYLAERSELTETLGGHGQDFDYFLDRVEDLDVKWNIEIQKVLREEGYDGIRYRNESPDEIEGSVNHMNMIVFEKNP